MMVKRGRDILRQKNLKLNKKNIQRQLVKDFSSVQGDTVSGDGAAVLMHWPPRSAVLAVIHDGNRFSLVVLHK